MTLATADLDNTRDRGVVDFVTQRATFVGVGDVAENLPRRCGDILGLVSNTLRLWLRYDLVDEEEWPHS